MARGNNKLLFLMVDALGISPIWKGNALLSASSRYLFDAFSANEHFLLDNPQLADSFYNQELIHGVISTGKEQLSNRNYFDKLIADKTLFLKKNLIEMYDQVSRRKSALHFVGCLPHEGSKYSSMNQLIELIRHARSQGILNIHLHLFLDETIDFNNATLSVNTLERELQDMQAGKVATISGINCLNKKNNVKEIIKALVLGKGHRVLSAGQAISKLSKEKGQNLPPHVIMEKKDPSGTIGDFDVLFFFDHYYSPIEPVLTSYLTRDYVNDLIASIKIPNFISFVSLFPVPGTEGRVLNIDSRTFSKTLPEILSQADYSQVEISDSSRIDHFKYCFDGGKEIKGLEKLFLPLEDLLVTNEKITKAVASIVSHNQFDIVFCEYSMLDHAFKSLEFNLAVKVLDKIDQNIKHLVGLAIANKYQVVITSNHGGVEKMGDLTDIERLNQKTVNPIPLILMGRAVKKVSQFQNIHDHFMYDMMRKRDRLTDVAPTLLGILGLPIEKQIEGSNLIQN